MNCVQCEDFVEASELDNFAADANDNIIISVKMPLSVCTCVCVCVAYNAFEGLHTRTCIHHKQKRGRIIENEKEKQSERNALLCQIWQRAWSSSE